MAKRTVRTIALAACAVLGLLFPMVNQALAQADLMQLNVKNASVEEILKLIAETGGFNIAIGDGVKGTVTLYMDDIAPRDLLEVVVGVIDAAFVEEQGSVWVMTKDRYESRYGQKFVDQLKSRTFALKEAKVADVLPSIRDLLGDKAVVKPDPARNMIRVKASPKLLQEASEMLKMLDQPAVTMGYDLHSMPASMASDFLGRLIPEQAIIVEDSLNNRLLVSASQFDQKRIANVLRMLDVGEGMESSILTLNYADPDSLASRLQPHLTPDIGQIYADRRSRKLVVVDFPQVVSLVSSLALEFDGPARQVLIEAKIIQVQISNEIRSGIDWSVLQDDINITGTFPTLAVTDPGFRGDFGDLTSRNFQIVIEALETYGNVELLSSPRLVVMDGGTGMIHVGSQVPYKTFDTRETASGVINQYEKVVIVDVGVKLEVEATINSDDMVGLLVRPEVSAVTGYSQDVPIIDASTADSSLIVENGNTIILGGLIKDEKRTTRKGVPILCRIPILKYLFSSNVEETRKSELVILLTPTIMDGRETYEKGEYRFND